MRVNARMILTAVLLVGCAPLAGCGGKEKGGNVVQMKDMEVVDGTATDAMTDLDGVQSEGTAVTLPVGNGAAGAAPKSDNAAAAKSAAEESEVVSDQ